MTDASSRPARRLFGSLRVRLLLGFTLVFSVAFAAVATWVIGKAISLVESQIATDLQNTLEQGAARVDGDALQALYQDLSSTPECAPPPGQESGGGFYPNDPRYWDHVQWLETIHTIEPRAYVYTYIRGERPNEMIFIGSNGATWDPPEGARFCYHFIAQDVGPPYQGLTETTLAMTIYADEWGHWVTGYAPITNSQGEVVAAMGVDFVADDIVMARQEVIRPLLTAFVLAYGVMSVLLFVVSGLVTRPLRVLTGAAGRIGEGQPVPELKRLQQPGYGSKIATLAHVLEETSSKRRQAEADIEEQRNLAETLTQTAELLTSSLDLETVLERILGLVGRVVESDGAVIMLGSREGSIDINIHGFDHIPGPVEVRQLVTIPAEQAEPLWAVLKRSEAAPFSNQALYRQMREILHISSNQIQSGVTAPIVVENEKVGLIFLGSTQPSFYQPAHAKRLEAFTNQAAIAITNAWLTRDLTEQKQELRQLSGQLIDTLEAERRRIAQELHDWAGQTFTAIEISLATVLVDLPPEQLEQVGDRLTESRELANQAVERVRELIMGLRPIMLDDLGLIPTLRWYLQRFSERMNIEVTMDLEQKEERLSPAYETVLYRSVQETLTNIARHAGATQVLVSLHWGDSRAELFIEDNGNGFDPKKLTRSEENSYSMGLLGIQERVAALNGTFKLSSEPGEGTETHIMIPLEAGSRLPLEG